METNDPTATPSTPVFIISGGAGALGKHVARIALSQFPKESPDVIVLPQIRRFEQLASAVEQAAQRGGIILHTMVDPKMRTALLALAAERNVPTVDTISEALALMSTKYRAEPLGTPGLYHGNDEAYLERIKAIEYTVDHDDGRNPKGLGEADVVLTGVSRVGKTPLSIYLSVLGWKVANVPLVPGISPPEELFQIDARRVIGLIIDVSELFTHRKWRLRSIGRTAIRSYMDLEQLEEELHMARHVFRKGGFASIDVSNRPVEETADDIIGRITRHFEYKVRPRPLGRHG